MTKKTENILYFLLVRLLFSGFIYCVFFAEKYLWESSGDGSIGFPISIRLNFKSNQYLLLKPFGVTWSSQKLMFCLAIATFANVLAVEFLASLVSVLKSELSASLQIEIECIFAPVHIDRRVEQTKCDNKVEDQC